MLAYVLIVLAAEHFAEQVQHSVELMLEVYWVVLLVDGLLHWPGWAGQVVVAVGLHHPADLLVGTIRLRLWV